MRTTQIRLAVAAVVALVLAVNATAQTKSSGLLNAQELRTLVTRAEPSDHARLTVHFRMLADRYAAEAKRHTSMAQSFAGNPSRNLGTGMSAHCRRLADLNTESATTVRELATYHEKLASGSLANHRHVERVSRAVQALLSRRRRSWTRLPQGRGRLWNIWQSKSTS